MSSSCSGCHNTGNQAITDISGFDSQALLASLKIYKQDENGNTAMHRITRGYTEAELQMISDFLGTDNE